MAIPKARSLARRLRGALTLSDPLRLADVRSGEIMGALVAEANVARDARDYHGAALLFEAALRIKPDHFGIQVQCGHMFKEAGDLAKAETHYLSAQRLSPEDADLALQLGHFYKIAGRLETAAASYRRALELSPGLSDPARELKALQARTLSPEALGHEAEPAQFDRLVPELFPKPQHKIRRTFVDSIHLRRLGARRERTRWGTMMTLRGIEAIRGFCISAEPIVEMTITFDGWVAHRGPVPGLPFDGAAAGQLKYVFNVWLDFTDVTPGPYKAEVRFTDAGGGVRTHTEYVVVAPALREEDFPGADALVNLAPDGSGAIEAQIDARPSMVRDARRNLFAEAPRSVLVMRTDQLGDMVTSVPAIRRLRELLPQARLVGLVTSGNAEFTATLGLFDEIIVADFPDDRQERRRIMDPQTQEALRRKLAAYDFDIAMDLAESAVSRPLLLLSGARFLYGYYDRDWPFLDGGFEGNSHDRKNDLETAPQSTKVRALVERLGSTLQTHAEVIRRPELTRAMLEAYGLGPQDRYVVFHTGARIVFSRWPYYPELAGLILERTELKVVIITDDAAFAARLPPSLTASPRFRLVDQKLPFDDFDALLSFCTVFVGNDTGPKHLAALRGSNVVSIHSSRINWGEWGQELTGSIISRKVPCAGCVIFHDEDECGKDFVCITRITVDEVFQALARWL